MPIARSATQASTSRLAGVDRYETSVIVSRQEFPTAPVVYLARGDAFPDALSGAMVSDGPVLLVPSCGAVPSVVAGEINRLAPARVVALGGSNALCDTTLRAAAGRRAARPPPGADRYEATGIGS